MKRWLLPLTLLMIGLISLALIFSLVQRDSQIRANNNQDLNYSWQDSILKFLPRANKDIKIRQAILDIRNQQNYIQKGLMFQDMIESKENCLSPLLSIRKDIQILKQLGIPMNSQIKNTVDNWLLFLGQDKPRNYLVLIQDPTIPRPAGGLLGDYCLLSFNQGKTNWHCGSVLDLDDLFIKKIIPPVPLQFISNKWFFHDLNWFFDFPTTGRKINQFYNDLDNNSLVSGVIAINPSVGGNILSVTGPISIPQYNLVINQDNFADFFQQEVRQSVRFNNLNKPVYSREIPTLLFQAISNKMSSLSASSLKNLRDLIQDGFNNKELQVYTRDDRLEYYFNTLGWTGSIQPTQNDYLAVVANNLQRIFTTDQRQKYIALTSQFTPSGVIHTLVIKADGESKEENYLQIYLPSGVSIIKAKNNYLKTITSHWPYKKLGFSRDPDIFLIDKTKIIDSNNRLQLLAEGNKTVVTTWARLSQHPFVLEYKTPLNRISSSWNLIFQKQSGQNENFEYKVIPPRGYKIRPTLFPLGKYVPVDNDLNITLDFTND